MTIQSAMLFSVLPQSEYSCSFRTILLLAQLLLQWLATHNTAQKTNGEIWCKILNAALIIVVEPHLSPMSVSLASRGIPLAFILPCKWQHAIMSKFLAQASSWICHATSWYEKNIVNIRLHWLPVKPSPRLCKTVSTSSEAAERDQTHSMWSDFALETFSKSKAENRCINIVTYGSVSCRSDS